MEPEALNERTDNEAHLHHGEVLSDAVHRSVGEGQVGVLVVDEALWLRGCCRVIGHGGEEPAFRPELFREGREAGRVPVERVSVHPERGAGRNVPDGRTCSPVSMTRSGMS